MLATIILDTFERKEAREIASALDDLCPPDHPMFFSSACIYAFWSVPEQQILYIGLAKNIAQRFRQHLESRAGTSGCKCDQIADYFSQNNRLGYSVIVQSGLTQPTTQADEAIIAGEDYFSADLSDYFGAEEAINVAEGMLLSMYAELDNQLPPWNEIGGLIRGRNRKSFYEFTSPMRMIQWAIEGKPPEDFAQSEEDATPFELILNLEGSELSELNARSTLREIANDATFLSHELFLHSVRLQLATRLIDFESALAVHLKNNEIAAGQIARMKADGYWEKRVTLTGVTK